MSSWADAGTALLVALHVVAATITVGHALLTKPDPRSAWGWIAVCALFPVAGLLLYYLFGIDRLRRRARSELGPAGGPFVPSPAAALAEIPQVPGVTRQEVLELVRIGEAMSGRPLTGGNAVEPLHNGEEAYPAMLQAIASARTSIRLATYIFESGAIGTRFAEALAAARGRGVEVRVLIDGIGDLYYRPPGSDLLAAHGVPVRRFMPPRLFPPMLHINLRHHRKLLTVDGAEAFIGGMNIGDYHVVRRRRRDATPAHPPTIDLHFRVRGPVVAQLEEVFALDWRHATGETLALAAADAARAGSAVCRALADGPNEDIDRLTLVLLGALATAHRSVRIMTPYFIPTPELARALQAAALRGVDVVLILPERSNLRWVDWASRPWLEPLLRREVRVLWRPPPFAHTKMFLVDDYYAQIGSANLDPRSLGLNFELMLEVFDPGLVGELIRHFDELRPLCRELRAADLASRSLPVRLRDAFFWLFSPYL